MQCISLRQLHANRKAMIYAHPEFADLRGYKMHSTLIHSLPVSTAYALVICNHGPQPWGIAGTLTFCFSIPCFSSPTLRGQSAGKITAVFPRSLLCFHCIALLYPVTSSIRPSVCPSVCLSVRPSVHQRSVSTPFPFQLSARCIFQPIFFKLGIRVDIGKECLGIADG